MLVKNAIPSKAVPEPSIPNYFIASGGGSGSILSGSFTVLNILKNALRAIKPVKRS